MERGQLRQNLAATQQLLAQLVTAYDPAGGGGAQRAGAELDSVQCAEQVVTQNCPFSEKRNADGFNPPRRRLPARPRSSPRGCWAAGPPSPRSCSSWPASTSRPTRPPRPSCGGCWGPAGGRWRAGRHDACINCNITIISAPACQLRPPACWPPLRGPTCCGWGTSRPRPPSPSRSVMVQIFLDCYQIYFSSAPAPTAAAPCTPCSGSQSQPSIVRTTTNQRRVL